MAEQSKEERVARALYDISMLSVLVGLGFLALAAALHEPGQSAFGVWMWGFWGCLAITFVLGITMICFSIASALKD